MIPNPWVILGAVLLWLGSLWGAYHWGHNNAENECAAEAGKAALVAEGKEDVRDERIADVGAETDAAVNAAAIETRGSADEAAERIRTVVVRADCRPVPADIVREHAEARERVNAKLRGGLRSSASGAAAPRPDD